MSPPRYLHFPAIMPTSPRCSERCHGVIACDNQSQPCFVRVPTRDVSPDGVQLCRHSVTLFVRYGSSCRPGCLARLFMSKICVDNQCTLCLMVGKQNNYRLSLGVSVDPNRSLETALHEECKWSETNVDNRVTCSQ